MKLIPISREQTRPLIVAALFTLVLLSLNIDKTLGNWLNDTFAGWLAHKSESSVVVLSIDTKSLNAIGTWPWSRDVYASAIDSLSAADVKNLFIDIDFSSPRQPEQDLALWRSVRAFSNNRPLFLPAFLQHTEHGGDTISITRPEHHLIGNAQLVSVNIRPASDSLVRDVSAGFSFEGQNYFTAGAVLANAAGAKTQIDYSISPQSFQYLSFIDLLEGRYQHDQLKGKTVLLGATAIELGDNVAVPVYGSLPGVVVQALVTETLYRGGLSTFNRTQETAAALALLSLLSIFILRRQWRAALAGLFILALGSQLLAIAFQFVFRIQPNYALPVIYIASLSLFLLTNKINRSTFEAIELKLNIRRKNSVLNALFDNSNDNILCINESGAITQSSASFCRLVGKTEQMLIGIDATQLIPELKASSLDASKHQLTNISLNQLDKIPVELSVNPIHIGNEISYALIIRDRREQLKREATLRHDSLHDKRTGLPNRRYLLDELDLRISNSKTVTLALLDISYFKEVNDHFGHNIGDSVLVELANRIESVVGDHARCFRLDGAEFAVLFKDSLSHNQVENFAKEVHHLTSQPICVEQYSVELGLYIGCARLANSESDRVELFRHADIALQRSKANHTLFAIFDSEIDNEQYNFLELLPKLGHAIETNQLRPVFQPKVCLKDETPAGCEMLLRWTDDKGQSIPPDVFIDVAENSQLMEPLIVNSMKQLLDLEALWLEAQLPRHVAVNLSARLLGNPAFINELINLAKTSMGYIELEFEITETALMANQSIAIKSANALRAAGFNVAIDDYGTGYSSLSYIRDLGAGTLKIDKSFIDNILQDENNRTIVRSTVSMARELRLKTVAEGIETREQAEFLQSINCDLAQGYLYSKPLSADDYISWCTQSLEKGTFEQDMQIKKCG